MNEYNSYWSHRVELSCWFESQAPLDHHHLYTNTLDHPYCIAVVCIRMHPHTRTHTELHTTERELEICRHVADTHLNLPSSVH